MNALRGTSVEPAEARATRRNITRFTALIGSGTMASRILGLVRDMVIAYLYPKLISDAFFVAFRLPNMLRELLAEGAMNAGFIPVFSDYLTNKTREETEQLAAVFLGIAAAVLMVVSALGVLFAPLLIRLITLEFGPPDEQLLLAIRLTRILFPYILLIGVASLLMAILNSLNRFFSSSYAPALLNLSMISAAYLLRNNFEQPVYAMAIGVIIGGILQILLQVPFIRRSRIPLRLRWNPRHPGVRRIFKLLVPTFFGQAVREVNVIADTMLAWYLGVGMVSALYFSYRLVHLPLAVFGLSTATALLPMMSRSASSGNLNELKQTLSLGIRSVLFIMLPATVGLIVLRVPIIRLLFEYGEFGAVATANTAFALLFYAVGLFSFSGAKVFAFAFYSMKETKLPVLVAAGAMVINIALNILLMIPLRQGGLALASSLSSTLNMALLWVLLEKRIGRLDFKSISLAATKIFVLSVVMGGWVYLLYVLCNHWVDTAGMWGRLVVVAVPLLGGIVFYLGAASAMRLEEAEQVRSLLRRRLRRASASSSL
jgi:putative peptidoglycan lipid II flippase